MEINNEEISSYILYLNRELNNLFEQYKIFSKNPESNEFKNITMEIGAVNNAINKLKVKLNRGIYLTKYGVECNSQQEAAYLDFLFDKMQHHQKIGR